MLPKQRRGKIPTIITKSESVLSPKKKYCKFCSEKPTEL